VLNNSDSSFQALAMMFDVGLGYLSFDIARQVVMVVQAREAFVLLRGSVSLRLYHTSIYSSMTAK
jgi:hypothetical protein